VGEYRGSLLPLSQVFPFGSAPWPGQAGQTSRREGPNPPLSVCAALFLFFPPIRLGYEAYAICPLRHRPDMLSESNTEKGHTAQLLFQWSLLFLSTRLDNATHATARSGLQARGINAMDMASILRSNIYPPHLPQYRIEQPHPLRYARCTFPSISDASGDCQQHQDRCARTPRPMDRVYSRPGMCTIDRWAHSRHLCSYNLGWFNYGLK